MDNPKSIKVPESLTEQVRDYRARVRWCKLWEAVGIAACSLLAGFGIVFGMDRFIDSQSVVRLALCIAALVGVACIPWAIRRWVVGLSTLESVARLLSRKMPAVGDALLGALELAQNTNEQSRSPVLCQAALEQVAADTHKRDLSRAIPDSQHTRWCSLAAVGTGLVVCLAVVFPAATWNAWQRFLLPMASIERFTFTSLESVPNRLVVPHGEDFDLSIRLASSSKWTPPRATAQIGQLPDIESSLQDGRFDFQIPAQLTPSSLSLKVGDAKPTIEVTPAMRPELEKLSATIQLPKYLQIPETFSKDVRGGAITVVRGATLAFQSKTSKQIAEASANAVSLPVQDGAFSLPTFDVTDTTRIELQWRDTDGLQAKTPFPLLIQSIEDEPPAVFADGLPRSRVMLDSEQVQFTLRALDDFGVQRVGLEWKTLESSPSTQPETGEVLLAAGGPTAASLDAMATFQATAMKIPSRPVEVRLFAEDYLPERGRVYSAPHALYVLSPNDHAIWMLDQINKWQRESLEVRDRELQLLANNKQIRDLPESELATAETRERIEQQAAAEQANGRRLANLSAKGEELLRQAARNSEIGVGHLEKWAEMQQVLKDIAANRMPSVAELLKKAANEQKPSKSGASSENASKQASVGKNQPSESASNTSESKQAENKPKSPGVTDQESSQQPTDPSKLANGEPKKSGPSALRLPTTTVAGSGANAKKEDNEETPEDSSAMEQAVRKQEELLAEFDKVADEMNNLMGNLEGSTLVKRLKAAAREQLQIADATGNEISDAFGTSLQRLTSEKQLRIQELGRRESNAVDFVSLIIDDMQGFQERRPSDKFESVLAEIKSEDLVGSLRALSERILEHQGLAIAEAEYWSDTLDRWAEDIVDPACKGECKGQKSKSSLPPSIVLEVMQVLEQEMNLRDRTRVAEQSKAASTQDEYLDKVDELTQTQITLQERIVAVRQKIMELPDSESEFGKEIGLMEAVASVMLEAASLLDKPNTGKEAVAAETEAIELLLQTRRSNPKKSGGGGASPGGGGGGTTDEAAIAMIGPGVNQNEQRQDHGVSQETGSSSNSLPEEFRFGLDEYFQRIDRKNLP